MLRKFGMALLVAACGADLPPSEDGAPGEWIADASADGCTQRCEVCEAECLGCALTGCEFSTCCYFAAGRVCTCDTLAWSPSPNCVVGSCL
jgi:hypothetical protein